MRLYTYVAAEIAAEDCAALHDWWEQDSWWERLFELCKGLPFLASWDRSLAGSSLGPVGRWVGGRCPVVEIGSILHWLCSVISKRLCNVSSPHTSLLGQLTCTWLCGQIDVLLYNAPWFLSEGTFSEIFTFSRSLMIPLLQAHILSPWLIRALEGVSPMSTRVFRSVSGSEISPYFFVDLTGTL